MWNERHAAPDPLATEIIRPSTAREVAAAMKRVSEHRLSTVIRGAGTKMAWGRAPSRIDVMLDMRRLNRVLEHQHGDLTATIEAGATLREVNDALSIRPLPTTPRLAASLPPTTADRCATVTARRAIS
jgi:glycolate dehydrogenase FAD-binding subunit